MRICTDGVARNSVSTLRQYRPRQRAAAIERKLTRSVKRVETAVGYQRGNSRRHSRRSIRCPMKNSGTNKAAACEGFILEIDGQFDSKYGSITAALNAGLEPKHKHAPAADKGYDAEP